MSRSSRLQSHQLLGKQPTALRARRPPLVLNMGTRQNLNPNTWLAVEDGTYRLIEPHVQQVRRIFELYLAGWTPTDIARELEHTWAGARVDRPKWDLKKVERFLKNVAVVGDEATWDKRAESATLTQRNCFPAVITRPEFEQVQAMLRADTEGLQAFRPDLDERALRGRMIAEVDLFHGLCYCLVCGKRLTPQRQESSEVWVGIPAEPDDAEVWATKPVSDLPFVNVVLKGQVTPRSVFKQGKRPQHELRYELKAKQPERRVVWARTPEGDYRPSVLVKQAAKRSGLVFWECACQGVGDVPAFFIEDFLFEVVLRAARLDLTRVFQLAPQAVAQAAQLAEQQKQLRQLAIELGDLDEAKVSLRLSLLQQDLQRIAGSVPRLTLLADDPWLVGRHEAYKRGLSKEERELVRRRLWAAGTRVYLLRVPGISSPDHKFVMTGKLVERWTEATGERAEAMLVHLRDGLDVLTSTFDLELRSTAKGAATRET